MLRNYDTVKLLHNCVNASIKSLTTLRLYSIYIIVYRFHVILCMYFHPLVYSITWIRPICLRLCTVFALNAYSYYLYTLVANARNSWYPRLHSIVFMYYCFTVFSTVTNSYKRIVDSICYECPWLLEVVIFFTNYTYYKIIGKKCK